MRRKWTVPAMLLGLLAGCPRGPQQQAPREYQSQRQVEPKQYQEPSKPPADLQARPKSK